MAYVFTKHFLESAKARGMYIEHITETIQNPDRIEKQEGDIIIHTKLYGDKVCRVVFLHVGSDQKLITFYYSSKIHKYLPKQ